MNRRTFVKATATSTVALAAPHLWIKSALAVPEEIHGRLDKAQYQKFADLALSLASRMGASYADIRICRYHNEDISTREDHVESINDSKSCGFGVRVLVNGT